MQAEKPVISEKIDKPVTSDKAKKIAAIVICFGLFAWITIFVTVPCELCDLLPKHYIWYAIIQGSAYFITYKISKKIMLNYKSIEFNEDHPYKFYNDDVHDISKKISNNITSANDLTTNPYMLASPYSYDRNYYSSCRND